MINFQYLKILVNIKILEKSKLLKKKQKVNINKKNIQWLNDLNELDNLPCIFLANEFFDALPIKQFIKKERKWFERHVRFFNNKFEYFDVSF